MKFRWAAMCLAGVICLFAACHGVSHNTQATLAYRLEAVPGEGWRVEARFGGLNRDRPRLRLLSAWGAFPDLAGQIRDLQAVTAGGADVPLIRATDARFAVWETRGDVTGPLVVRYRVESYDRYVSPEASYAEAEEALGLGYCLFLAPDEVTDYLDAPITVEVVAPWPVWTSWPGGRPETLHDLWSGVVVAGAFQEINLGASGARVSVLTDSSWSGALGMSVANRLLPVIREMRDLFGAAPRRDELEVLALFRTAPPDETRSFMIGVSEESAFLCLATPDRYRDLTALTALAAHECLHFYLGGALTAEAEPPFQNNPDLIWFFEGVTEYLAYKLMRRAGVMSEEDLQGVRRLKARKIERRALSDMRLADAARMYQWPEVYELIYNKGYFLAEYLDESMADRCGEGAFEAAVRTLFTRYNFYRTHRHLRQKTVMEVFEAECPGSADWISTYIVGNAPLPRDGWTGTEKAAPGGAAYTR